MLGSVPLTDPSTETTGVAKVAECSSPMRVVMWDHVIFPPEPKKAISYSYEVGPGGRLSVTKREGWRTSAVHLPREINDRDVGQVRAFIAGLARQS